MDKPATPIITNEETNDTIHSISSNDSAAIEFNKRPLDDDSNSVDMPVSKRIKEDIGDK